MYQDLLSLVTGDRREVHHRSSKNRDRGAIRLGESKVTSKYLKCSGTLWQCAVSWHAVSFIYRTGLRYEVCGALMWRHICSNLMRSSKAHGPWPDKSTPCRTNRLMVVGIDNEETLHCQKADVEDDEQSGLDQSIHYLKNSIPILNRDYSHCCQHK